MFSQKLGKLLVIKPPFSAWPVGFAYVLACLEEHNISFDFIDASRTQNLRKDIRIMLSNNSYIAVASGGLIGFFRFFKEIARMIQKYQAGIPFILGGNITKDAFNDLLFEYIGMNFGILGEAETSLPGLIDSIINKDDNIGDMTGILYKNAKGDIIRKLPQRFNLKKKNILPAWHNFDVDYYIKNSQSPFIGNDLNFMAILTGRGCVGKCTFCSPSIGGFRKRPIEHVMFEIEYLSSNYDFDRIMFYNEMFYPTAHEIRDFCDQYILLNNKKPWIAQVRVDSNIDVKTFGLMKEAGCIVVSAGIESGSDKVLSQMNKKVTSEQIGAFFRNAKMANMPTNGTFIVGNEGETEEDVIKTIDLVIDEEINTGESLMYVYPGTVVYDNALKKGLIKNEMLHLEKTLKNTSGLFSENVKDAHLNISKMSDDKFLDIATREARRYNTFVLNRYPVKDLSCKIEIEGKTLLMIMEGKCQECNCNVTNRYNIFSKSEYEGLFGWGIHNRYICPQCFKQLSFNIYECKEMERQREHLCLLKEEMSKRNKIIIGGINQDAMFILRINMLNLDYKKILGFIDFTGQYRAKYYVNYPVFNVDDVVDLNPDCILMLDIISDGENIIRKLYNIKNINAPECLYLFDVQLRGILKKTINEVGGSYYYKFYYWLRNKYRYLKEYCDQKGIHLPEYLTDFAAYFGNKHQQNEQRCSGGD